jgi:chromosome segregation ATPase
MRELEKATIQVSVNPLNVDAGGSQRELVNRPEEEFSLSTDDATNPFRDAITNLSNQINQYDRQIKQLESQLRDPNLNLRERADIKRRLEQTISAMNNVRDERRKLRAAGVEEVGNETSSVDEGQKQAPDR